MYWLPLAEECFVLKSLIKISNFYDYIKIVLSSV